MPAEARRRRRREIRRALQFVVRILGLGRPPLGKGAISFAEFASLAKPARVTPMMLVEFDASAPQRGAGHFHWRPRCPCPAPIVRIQVVESVTPQLGLYFTCSLQRPGVRRRLAGAPAVLRQNKANAKMSTISARCHVGATGYAWSAADRRTHQACRVWRNKANPESAMISMDARRRGASRQVPALTLAQVSRRPTVRLNTGLPGAESGSRTK